MSSCRSCHAEMPCSCCQPFDGARTRDGYGIVYAGRERPRIGGRNRGRYPVLAHRHVMQQHIGRELGAGEIVMHECDNPPCVFLGHLRIATQAENMADMARKGRAHRHGHPGSSNPAAKLTEAQVVEIRPMKGTASSRIVGLRFGVSGSLIRDIWAGKRWTHVA